MKNSFGHCAAALLFGGLMVATPAWCKADLLADLARPHDGRSMRASSAHRIGPAGKYDPYGQPDPDSNWDNKNVLPGETKVLLDAQGPGVITHIIEHYGWISPDENPDYKSISRNERQDDYSSVAFWYQAGTPTFAARAADGPDRILPSLDTIFHAASYTDDQYHGNGAAVTQQLLDYPQGQLLYRPKQADDAWIEIPFDVTEQQPVRLLLNMTRADDFGRYQAELNGVKIGPVLDFYHGEIDNWEYHLLDLWPDPGHYRLRLKCVGKNPLSTDYRLGIESVRLRQRRPRVKTWAHDKDKDWRVKPMLYR